MTEIVNDNLLSNTSYTQKDFQTIYPELLDLVKQISPKWDPSISNESDPGVLLLKLAAIIADKNNYNIDKSVLECFPISVTQETHARELFAQLGYFMSWYKAATGTVSFKWMGDQDNVQYTIPRFSMISDADNTAVYALTQDVVVPANGVIVTANIIQGVAVEYNINSQTLINVSHLDSTNRLYFPRLNVAENGIFICNADSVDSSIRRGNYEEWKKVDNLAVEKLGNTIYTFGITSDGKSCYIEFPEDVQDLFINGIYITYILTDGLSGNIAKKILNQFYTDTNALYTDEETKPQEILLNADNMFVSNADAIQNGDNPEDIDSAYKNFKKTIGTFNTLVTINDYSNAIKTSGLVSNGFVTDRTNDIQSSYKIITQNNDMEDELLQVENIETLTTDVGTSGQYSLILPGYADSSVTVSGITCYTKFYKDSTKTDLLSGNFNTLYINLEAGTDISKVYKFSPSQSIYIPLTASNTVAVPDLDAFTLKLYALQNVDAINNASIYDKSFEILPYTEKNISPIITNLIDSSAGYLTDLKSIQHDFKHQRPFKPVLFKNKYAVNCTIIPQYKLTGPQIDEIRNNIIVQLYAALNSKQIDFGESIPYDLVYDVISNSDERIKAISLSNIEYDTYAVYYDNTDETPTKKGVYKEINISNDNLYIYGYAYDSGTGLQFYTTDAHTIPVEADETKYYVDIDTSATTFNKCYIYNSTTESYEYKCPNFKTEIYAKNVLAGRTQLLVPNTSYQYNIDQKYMELIEDIVKITTNTNCCCVGEPIIGDPQIESVIAGVGSFSVTGALIPGSLVIDIAGLVLVDDGKGGLLGAPLTESLIDYSTGAISFELVDTSITESASVTYTYTNAISTGEELIYTVKQNEGIQFMAPNLMQSSQYSTYVRYQFYGISQDIPANSDYQLKENESITFYWRESDEDDEPYQYYKYGYYEHEDGETYGDIINPSFTLLSKNKAGSDYVAASFEYGQGTILDGNQNESLKNMTAPEKVLSGTKTINIKDINKVVINDSTQYAYWILNEMNEEGNYELFTSGQTEYILQSGEHFIYTTDSGARLVDLGVGTKIYRTGLETDDLVEWVCEPIDYDELVSDSSILDNIWVQIPSRNTIYAAEMQFIFLGPTVKLKLINKTEEEVFFVNFHNSGYEICSTSASPLKLSDFSMSYNYDGGWKEIPTVALAGVNGWQGNSILNLNSTIDKSQKLYEGQTISWVNKKNMLGLIVGRGSLSDTTNTPCLMPDRTLNIPGGININTKSVDIYGVSHYVSLYVYKDNKNTTDFVYGLSDISVIFNRPTEGVQDTFEKSLTFKVPTGKYILPFQMNASGLSDVQIQIKVGNGDYTNLHPFGRDHIKNLNLQNMYYLNLDLMSAGDYDVELKITVTYAAGIYGSKKLIFTPLYKYVTQKLLPEFQYTEVLNSIITDAVVDKILELDPFAKYNFTYVVPEDKLIENPLSANTFLNLNHVFNKNTICQMETTKNSIVISNKVK